MAGLLDFLGGGRSQMPGQQGGLSNLLDPGVALPMAAALMGNQGNTQNFANAFAAAGPAISQSRESNRTYQWLKQNAPEFAQLIDGGMDGKTALDLYAKQRYAQQPKGTDDMREYEFAKQQGYGGSFMDFQLAQRKAGATNINNNIPGVPNIGTIPQGFQGIQDPESKSWRLERIPGGPEDNSEQEAWKSGQAEVASRVVTSAAQRAREAAGNRNFGHVGQGLAANVPWTDSAEVSRQVEVLKSTAKVENLNAMRQASPTGGALGSVTEKEAEMLADKSGTLNPSSPNFQRDLDDYELTLLQVIHGPEVGSQIFQQSRQGDAAPSAPQGSRTRSGVQWSVTP